MIPEQYVVDAHIDISQCEHFARVAAHDAIGERIWLRVNGRFTVDYRATVRIDRVLRRSRVTAGGAVPSAARRDGPVSDGVALLPVGPVRGFRACRVRHADRRRAGRRDARLDRSALHLRSGSSTSATTALESFVQRKGVCRDYAHVLITLARASGIPARIASVYALGVDPQDFHAVAEVFLRRRVASGRRDRDGAGGRHGQDRRRRAMPPMSRS